MNLKLPKVYPITDTRLSGLSHAEQVRRLIEGGATLIQLRDKLASARDFYREAEPALRVARDRHIKLIVNDRVDVAFALKADGVHLGQSDLPARVARHVLGPAAIIGLSTHNLEQARRAAEQPVDYIAFGPIFMTSTKEAPDPTTGLAALKSVRDVVDMPIVAIGGITISNAAKVLNAGADAVATISSVIGDPAAISENIRRMFAEAPD